MTKDNQIYKVELIINISFYTLMSDQENFPKLPPEEVAKLQPPVDISSTEPDFDGASLRNKQRYDEAIEKVRAIFAEASEKSDRKRIERDAKYDARGAAIEKDFDAAVAASSADRAQFSADSRKRRQKNWKEFQGDLDDIAGLADQDRKSTIKGIEHHQEEDSFQADTEHKFIDERSNQKLIKEYFNRAATTAHLSENDLPQEFIEAEVGAQEAEIFLVAYVKYYLGFNRNMSGKLFHGLDVESVSRLMAMPNEVTTQLYELIKDRWQGEEPLTPQYVGDLLNNFIRDLKTGVADVISTNKKDAPMHESDGAEKVRHLDSLLLVTANPEHRKKLLLEAVDWFVQDQKERAAAQGERPMATRL